MGLKYLIDTNSVGLLLQRKDLPFQKKIKKEARFYVSVITIIEYLSNAKLSPSDKYDFETFVERTIVVDVQHKEEILLQKIITIRKKYNLKTPDAIIAAQAIINDLILITNDEGFTKIFGLQIEQL